MWIDVLSKWVSNEILCICVNKMTWSIYANQSLSHDTPVPFQWAYELSGYSSRNEYYTGLNKIGFDIQT
jgi:hypothetical protein